MNLTSEDCLRGLFSKIQSDRLNAVSDIGMLKKSEARKLLIRGLEHWDRQVRKACITKLRVLLGSGCDELIVRLARNRQLPALFAIRILKRSPSRAAAIFLCEIIASNMTRIDGEAYRLLSGLESKWAVLCFLMLGWQWKPRYGLLLDQLTPRELRTFLSDNTGLAKNIVANQDFIRFWQKNKRFNAGLEKLYPIHGQRLDVLRQQLDIPGKQIKDDWISPLSEKINVPRSVLCFFAGCWRQDAIDEMYDEFDIPKADGSERTIYAPEDSLKSLQRSIYDYVLRRQRLHETCHGFREGRSIVTNAALHVGKKIVINMDLKDFFPSITAKRVFGLFRDLGFDNRESSFLTALTTYSGELPQGAPSSPAIANLVCRRLDARLMGLILKCGASYTRYADDITISGNECTLSVLPSVRKIISEEGFSLAPSKTRIIRRESRQEVTGLTVNSKVTVPRKIRKMLRAAAHYQKTGRTMHLNGRPLSMSSFNGHVSFVHAVQPETALEIKNWSEG